ncbi:MAG: pantetheine-phosphate adenylyltransferase [Rickettsiales bacterium]|nr:pantetheine-phosphate adenylyltransferase [Pseudomonadota bacterium]MDA0965366.1 pantetheine-phosphate adenylyltransferase [Pseudomonadota bacterium]MDG4544294.1 pantetheine-phosphate adenylyltransferase [Rickettsiales bacterium]MDG4544861.1 pantetheine-phosphate adenylyltransferase [Rickettsiales bacterium]MDG4546983.1 pantetheine-phosphate adenylyltransferase [Rickettsiales bacterium]
MPNRTAVYPGTFDPITLGHKDIIKRAVKIVDKLIIAVAVDTAKTPIFSLDERVEMVKADVADINSNIEVVGFEGLLVNFARDNGAGIIIRGLRAVSDFEYEFQMSGMNSKMNPDIQTVFLPASESTHFIASRFVKEIVRLGGNVDELVSENVKNNLTKYYNT